MNSDKITQAIEHICAEGCTSVNNIIITLEKGEPNKHTEQLDEQEVQTVLLELKTIMAVYERDK